MCMMVQMMVYLVFTDSSASVVYFAVAGVTGGKTSMCKLEQNMSNVSWDTTTVPLYNIP